jgi:hypothetical protein
MKRAVPVRDGPMVWMTLSRRNYLIGNGLKLPEVNSPTQNPVELKLREGSTPSSGTNQLRNSRRIAAL